MSEQCTQNEEIASNGVPIPGAAGKWILNACAFGGKIRTAGHDRPCGGDQSTSGPIGTMPSGLRFSLGEK